MTKTDKQIRDLKVGTYFWLRDREGKNGRRLLAQRQPNEVLVIISYVHDKDHEPHGLTLTGWDWNEVQPVDEDEVARVLAIHALSDRVMAYCKGDTDEI
jgi:hypothetical protein